MGRPGRSAVRKPSFWRRGGFTWFVRIWICKPPLSYGVLDSCRPESVTQYLFRSWGWECHSGVSCSEGAGFQDGAVEHIHCTLLAPILDGVGTAAHVDVSYIEYRFVHLFGTCQDYRVCFDRGHRLIIKRGTEGLMADQSPRDQPEGSDQSSSPTVPRLNMLQTIPNNLCERDSRQIFFHQCCSVLSGPLRQENNLFGPSIRETEIEHVPGWRWRVSAM